MILQGCNAGATDAELARFAAMVSELLAQGFDLEEASEGVSATSLSAALQLICPSAIALSTH